MKIMIASDIHGSSFYLNKLCDAIDTEKPDKILLLGDILYHGPRNNLPKEYEPKKVIEKLNNLKDRILCVRGNCDTEVDQMVLSFPIMSDYAVIFVDGVSIYLSHGHKFNKDNLPPLSKGNIFLSGHSHIPLCDDNGDVICLNPGSVSIPKENSPNSYMIYENMKFIWKKLDGSPYMKLDLKER